jgi:hypothetical protein
MTCLVVVVVVVAVVVQSVIIVTKKIKMLFTCFFLYLTYYHIPAHRKLALEKKNQDNMERE